MYFVLKMVFPISSERMRLLFAVLFRGRFFLSFITQGATPSSFALGYYLPPIQCYYLTQSNNQSFPPLWGNGKGASPNLHNRNSGATKLNMLVAE